MTATEQSELNLFKLSEAKFKKRDLNQSQTFQSNARL